MLTHSNLESHTFHTSQTFLVDWHITSQTEINMPIISYNKARNDQSRKLEILIKNFP